MGRIQALESRPSRKGSCVSQCRTPDAPEMRQCQTKSFLGNLVRFKTCNHDLRNSLKNSREFRKKMGVDGFRRGQSGRGMLNPREARAYAKTTSPETIPIIPYAFIIIIIIIMTAISCLSSIGVALPTRISARRAGASVFVTVSNAWFPAFSVILLRSRNLSFPATTCEKSWTF